MFQKLIEFVIARRWLVLFAVVCLGGLGVYNYGRLPIDAVPDITNVQVQINTAAPGYSPLEAEQRITFPIESVMNGLPRLESTRSLSKYGLSQVTVVFKDGTDIYFARQLVNERLQEARARLPDGVEPGLGPTATGLGEIFYWTVEAKEGARKPDGSPEGRPYAPADLREIQDWIVAPQLRGVPGVTEVNTIGGHLKEYQVAPDMDKLAAHGLSLGALHAALERNNSNAGAGYIERGGEQFVVRAPGQVQSLDQIRDIVLALADGMPLRVRDVAVVEPGRALRTGAATENGREVVLGAVFMLIGENSRAVAESARLKLAQVNRSLPAGVQALPVYDRSVLVNKAIATVRGNLLEGAVLVIAILFLFLGNLRAALVTALVIPLSMLMVFTGMVQAGVSANLMSLGALDFGIIVDGAVVIVENCIRRLGTAQARYGRLLSREERFAEVAAAAAEARRPLLFGQLIIITVYLPIFALSGVEGRMFHPMAITVVMALAAAMLLSVTFVPAAVALCVRGKVAEHENRLVHGARRLYLPLLDRVLRNRPVALAFAVLAVLLSGMLATRLGTEFAPNLDEGDLAVLTMRIPGTSLQQSVAMQQHLESALLQQFPEIERMFARIGTAEVATDPMPPNAADSYIILRPERAWPAPRKTHAELVAAITEAAQRIPGNNYEFSQPIQLRFNELISGVRSDVAVKVFGDDAAAMAATVQQVARVLNEVPGAAEVKVEQVEGLPALTLRVDRARAARYGLNVADVQETFGALVGGRAAGTVFEGDRRFALTIRLGEGQRNDIDVLRRMPVALPASEGRPAASIPLSEIATLDFVPEANQISRENGKRRIVVSANVRGRDLGSFVGDVQARLAQVKLPPGVWLGLGGQFENLQTASRRLALVIPAALALVFALLYLMFNSVKDGLLVFSGIPFAMSGGVLALWLRGLPLSISAAIGFIALSGVAVLNGLVMMSFVRALREQGMGPEQAMREGAQVRLRAVLMTALVASLGFLPMALATSTGAEVQRPLATVVIGGILSSTALTLLILPALYTWAHRKEN
jgi:cobalt-zinc-cadmium resistance protein CzcA